MTSERGGYLLVFGAALLLGVMLLAGGVLAQTMGTTSTDTGAGTTTDGTTGTGGMNSTTTPGFPNTGGGAAALSG